MMDATLSYPSQLARPGFLKFAAGENSIIEALRKRRHRIRYIGARHEERAAFTASGSAKLWADGFRCERPGEVRAAVQPALRLPNVAIAEPVVDAHEKPGDPNALRI